MDIGKYIRELLNKKEKTIRWLAEQLNINEKTLQYKLSHNSISFELVVKISIILNFDLNQFKYSSNIINNKIPTEHWI